MKKALFLFFVLSSNDTQAQSDVKVVDSTFIQAVSMFIDSASQLNLADPVIVVAQISHLEANIAPLDRPAELYVEHKYQLTLTLERNRTILEKLTPPFVFELRGKQVFIGFKIEGLFALSDKDRKALIRKAKKTIKYESLRSSTMGWMVVAIQGKSIRVIEARYH